MMTGKSTQRDLQRRPGQVGPAAPRMKVIFCGEVAIARARRLALAPSTTELIT